MIVETLHTYVYELVILFWLVLWMRTSLRYKKCISFMNTWGGVLLEFFFLFYFCVCILLVVLSVSFLYWTYPKPREFCIRHIHINCWSKYIILLKKWGIYDRTASHRKSQNKIVPRFFFFIKTHFSGYILIK